MASAFEAVVALALTGSIAAVAVANLAATVRLGAAAGALARDTLALRQLEDLVDRAGARAGAGPSPRPPVASATPESVVLVADLDGDGRVDDGSAETTALEIRRDRTSASLRLRLGRQTMTMVAYERASLSLDVLDRRGERTRAEWAALISLAIEAPPRGSRRLLFALPAASVPGEPSGPSVR